MSDNMAKGGNVWVTRLVPGQDYIMAEAPNGINRQYSRVTFLGYGEDRNSLSIPPDRICFSFNTPNKWFFLRNGEEFTGHNGGSGSIVSTSDRVVKLYFYTPLDQVLIKQEDKPQDFTGQLPAVAALLQARRHYNRIQRTEEQKKIVDAGIKELIYDLIMEAEGL